VQGNFMMVSLESTMCNDSICMKGLWPCRK